MQEGSALRKTVLSYIKHKQKNLVNSGLRQDIAEKARTVNFIIKQEKNRKRIRNSLKKTNFSNKEELNEISPNHKSNKTWIKRR